MSRILLALLCVLISGKSHSQHKAGAPFIPTELKRVVIIQPTGETVNDLSEMTVLADTTARYKMVMANIKNSFVYEFLDLYFIAQVYLKNKHQLDNIEPAYLALTENQGGFAKFGFAIKDGGGHVLKKKTAYIDITVKQASEDPNKLMSFTQLYPHEMGHVFLHLLCPEDSLANNTKNVDMHFFSLVTDYSTAFNEGFAEHLENVSRAFEKNENIKSGILADVEKIEHSSKQSIKGFERDFTYPFRLGYYKASMLGWYQKYEDYKRYTQAHNGDIRYKNTTLTLANVEDQLTFRNAGVILNKKERRNLVQLHSTEGAISAFFTHLSTSDLSDYYLAPNFYQPFVYDTNAVLKAPQDLFTPLQNQFIKYFKVLHKHVVFNNSPKSQLTDFIDGYLQAYPSEATAVSDIYKKALGTEYSNQLPPPLWLLIKNYSHRLVAFDPFDAITVPVYTFDLNAAEIEDLQTITGLTKSAAEKIINYRNENGFFTDLEQVKKIPGLDETTSKLIIAAAFDNAFFEEMLKDFEPKLSIGTLISQPLKYLFSRSVFYFIILFGAVYFVLIRPQKTSTRQTIFLLIKYFLLWLFFVLAGLVAIFLFEQHTYLYVLSFATLSALIALAIYRKDKAKRLRTLSFIGLMNLLVLLSIV